jgi:nitrate reductase NapE
MRWQEEIRMTRNLHSSGRGDPVTPDGAVSSRKREILLFLILAVLIWPFIAVGVVAGWGFLVWMYQLIVGPPGPL